jgi:pimeloyl-ACP methyl ester carboxylesterase
MSDERDWYAIRRFQKSGILSLASCALDNDDHAARPISETNLSKQPRKAGSYASGGGGFGLVENMRLIPPVACGNVLVRTNVQSRNIMITLKFLSSLMSYSPLLHFASSEPTTSRITKDYHGTIRARMHKAEYAGRVGKNAVHLQDGLKWGRPRWTTRLWRGRKAPTSPLRAAAAMLATTALPMVRSRTQMIPKLKEFRRPVRIIFGDADPSLNSGVARTFHEFLPGSELFLIPGARHFVQLDEPEQVARLILAMPGPGSTP